MAEIVNVTYSTRPDGPRTWDRPGLEQEGQTGRRVHRRRAGVQPQHSRRPEGTPSTACGCRTDSGTSRPRRRRRAGQSLRKGGAKFLGFNALVLTTVGAKTGPSEPSRVGWFPGPDGSYLIVASAAGAPRNPAWYYNLAAHPGQVSIEVGGRKVTGYQGKTDREIPVIRLVPRP